MCIYTQTFIFDAINHDSSFDSTKIIIKLRCKTFIQFYIKDNNNILYKIHILEIKISYTKKKRFYVH